jgi:uncharacterized protein (TIGR02246 family)
MQDLEGIVADLARRVRALEDELAIHRLIVRYGLAADAGDAEGSAGVFTEDGVYDVDVGRMEGREAVRRMIRGERHQAMVGHCAHQIGPATVTLDAPEHATAVGYSRVYLQTPAGTHVYRVSLNRWELVKRDGEWLITRRTTRILGHPEALAVLGRRPLRRRARRSARRSPP